MLCVIRSFDFPQIQGCPQILSEINLWASPNLWEMFMQSFKPTDSPGSIIPVKPET